MRKRILCAVLSLLMLVTMLPITVGADETSVIDLAFTQRETATGATEVSVGVDMSGNPGLVSATIPIQWDNNVLKLKSVTPSTDIFGEGWCGMSMDEYTSNGTYYLAWSNDTRTAGNFTTDTGCLAELVFTIVDPTVDTSTALKFNMADAIANLMNFDMEDLNETNTVTANAGTVKVTAKEAGGTDPDPTPEPSGAKIVVSSVTAKTGTKAVVTVSLENNPGIINMVLGVDWDGTVMDLVSVEDTKLISGYTSDEENISKPYTLAWNNGTVKSDLTVNGVIAKLTFDIKDDAKEGDYSVEITYDNDNEDIINYELETVDFAIENGTVKVVDFIYGDLNGDGKVTNTDSVILMRYVAKWPDYIKNDFGYNYLAADVNCDGKVTNKDSVILMRKVARWTEYQTLPYIMD